MTSNIEEKYSVRIRDEFVDRVAGVIGEENVIRADGEAGYDDPYPLDPRRGKSPGFTPTSTEQIQEIVRLANEAGVSLWTFSRGKNLGYGGSSPRVPGSVVLDLHKMNRIIEVNDELCYAIVEPGVSFFDLYEYIAEHDLLVWPSVPALGWGSVMGNTLDRGWGYHPMGDNSNQQCGMEVVLPDGDLLRTGMGAIEGTSTWALFKGGFGPGLDTLFMQSNLGIVTKMGIWLYPMPSGFTSVNIDVEHEADLPALIDNIAELRRKDIIQNNPVVGNTVRLAAAYGHRDRYYDGPGAMPDEVLERIRSELGIGSWNARFALYGDAEMMRHRLSVIKERFASLPGFAVTATEYLASDGKALRPTEVDVVDRAGQVGYPSLAALESVKWRGENGGHIGFAPILPPKGDDVYEFYLTAKKISAQYGFDFYAGFHVYARHMAHIDMIMFDQDDLEQVAAAKEMFGELVKAARDRGYSEYRAHIDFMDLVGDQYDFNGHALRRTQEKLKDALDPAGILSPGKQGIWPSRFR